MNTFQLFQLRRLDIIFYLRTLFAYRVASDFERPVTASLIAKLICKLVFAKARAANVLVKRLQKKFDVQILEQMVSILGEKYTREFCNHFGFPYPTQMKLAL